MKLIVAISGPAGSGKTTIARQLSKDAKLRYWSNGEQFRRMASEKGMSFQAFHAYAEKHPEIDRTLDDQARSEAEKGSVVLDGRLSGWITRDMNSLKVYLTAPMETRLERVVARDATPRDETLASIKKRERSNRERYRRLYGYDIENLEIYDIILNTQTWAIAEVLEILKFVLRSHFQDLPVPMEKHYASH